MEAALLPTTPYTHGRAYSESRIAVDDGYIWPFQRPQMVAPGAITERMVEDIGALVRDGGEDAVVTLQDLGRLGWRPAQVEAHGEAAFALFHAAHRRKPRRITGNRSTVRRPSLAGEAAVLALFAVPVALLARQMLGL
jgi:hypothetical protein